MVLYLLDEQETNHTNPPIPKGNNQGNSTGINQLGPVGDMDTANVGFISGGL